MNLTSISTQLLYTTVPIWVELDKGQQSFGTGFIYAIPIPGQPNTQVPLLISNQHVFGSGRRAIAEFVSRKGEVPDPGNRTRVEIPGQLLNSHTDPANDLAAVPIGGVLTQLEQSGRPVFFRSISPDLVPPSSAIDDLGAVEEITFIGYPSGLYDQHNATPLVRRGITATPVWNDFQGQSAFLIDAGVFPGSSGSPVFILNEGGYTTRQGIVAGNRLLFLGVLSEAILRQEKLLPNVFLGIGKVIKSSRVQELGNRFLTTMQVPGGIPKA